MTGVEILYQEPIMVNNLLHDILLVIGFFGAIVFIILGFIYIAKHIETIFPICLVGLITCFVLCMITAADPPFLMNDSDRYKYEVTISEDVSMIEFYEKYDVIEQRGEIWVIEDKE